ncbi:hypothetical protein CRG98_033163 [Punica granatum]|uniref:Uncharacterized protein n=1 Tax=Punica granatum TaxID=22663 RepID=A0A2I0IR38_PUNGR|nr:hypothetical protein CRG98_033163 [Punica granatum]
MTYHRLVPNLEAPYPGSHRQERARVQCDEATQCELKPATQSFNNSSSTINMISLCFLGDSEEDSMDLVAPIIINYEPFEPLKITYVTPDLGASLEVIEFEGRAPFHYESNRKVPWVSEAQIVEPSKDEFMKMTRFGRNYEAPSPQDKGKAPKKAPEEPLKKKVTNEESLKARHVGTRNSLPHIPKGNRYQQGLSFCPTIKDIVEARSNRTLGSVAHDETSSFMAFFWGPPQLMGGTLADSLSTAVTTTPALLTLGPILKETFPRDFIRHLVKTKLCLDDQM